MRRIGKRKLSIPDELFSALLFALFHLNPWQLGPTFLLGLLLGYVRLRTGSLLAAIFTHALHNGMIFLSVYFKEGWSVQYFMQPGSVQSYIISFILLASGVTIVYFFTEKNRYKNYL